MVIMKWWGTKVAITAQLSCYQCLMEALDRALIESNYLYSPKLGSFLTCSVCN